MINNDTRIAEFIDDNIEQIFTQMMLYAQVQKKHNPALHIQRISINPREADTYTGTIDLRESRYGVNEEF